MSIVPFRDTCLYSWECSCLDNRSGVSCIHRHAVQIFGRGLTTSCTAESKGQRRAYRNSSFPETIYIQGKRTFLPQLPESKRSRPVHSFEKSTDIGN
ncbi:hypothetical protein V3C99_018047 [Haemonchus contortus]